MNENTKTREDEERWEESGRAKLVFDEHVLDRPIKSIGMRPAACVEEGTALADAIIAMRDKRIGSVMVTRNGRLAGIITERDFLKRTALGEMNMATTKVEALMNRNPGTLTPDHPIAYGLNAMSQGGYRHVPLVDGSDRPIGILSMRDIVDYLAEFFKEKVQNLPPTFGVPPKREGG